MRRAWLSSMLGLVVVLSWVGPVGAAPTPNPDGFSRADEFPGTPPAVTTRLLRLDERGFPKNLPETVVEARALVFQPRNAWEELDDIYGLMALAVVHADWQEATAAKTRGYNIGGVIVDDKLEVANWERNSNEAMCNGTQHGETRMMLKQLNRTGSRDLRNYQIYTSLEPCMMCSGMMMQQRVLRTVYMQTDNVFGKNLERLSLDASASPIRFDGEDTGQDGYSPAARPVIASMGASEFRVELDVAWREASKNPKITLTDWLRSPEAEDIYRRARAKFASYPLRFPDDTATARFIVPKGALNPEMAEKDFLQLHAVKTNKELYAAAIRFFDDPARDVVPYIDPDGPRGPKPIVEDKDNVMATRLFESPAALVRAEHPKGASDPSGPAVPKQQVLVVDGTVAGAHIHQERVRLDCPVH